MRVRSVLFRACLILFLAETPATHFGASTLADERRVHTPNADSTVGLDTNSPQGIYRRFRKAIANDDWAAEYRCYTPEFQEHLLYRVVLLALHLEYDMDLFLQAEDILARHGLTDAELEPFWPNAKSRVLIVTSDDAGPIVKWKSDYQTKMRHWSEEFHSRISNGAQLISELQPLIAVSSQRHPESTISRELEVYGHHAFGRICHLEIQEDGQAIGTIRTKTTNGYFVSAPNLKSVAEKAGGCGGRFGVLDPAVECRLQSVDPNCYTEIWEAASELQMISDTLPKNRFAVIGMLTGDLAIELNESLRHAYEAEYGEDGLTIDDFEEDSAGAELDMPNNGTRTVSESKVEFQVIEGRWLISDISYR